MARGVHLLIIFALLRRAPQDDLVVDALRGDEVVADEAHAVHIVEVDLRVTAFPLWNQMRQPRQETPEKSYCNSTQTLPSQRSSLSPYEDVNSK